MDRVVEEVIFNTFFCMKLTKSQLSTIVSTVTYNERQKLLDADAKRRESKEVRELVDKVDAEFWKISDTAWRLSQWKYCNREHPRPSRDTLIEWAMRELWLKESTELPNWFRDQLELKIQMAMVDAKDLADLEKKVWYNFVVV